MGFELSHKTQNGVVYRKDVLRVFQGVHPSTKQKLDFTEERLLQLQNNTNKWIQNGRKVTFPIQHSDYPLDNAGYWYDFEYDKESQRLYAKVEVLDQRVAEAIEKGTLPGVSVGILSSFTDTDGTEYDGVIYHVAGVTVPVVTHQEEFVALSVEFLEEKDMSAKEDKFVEQLSVVVDRVVEALGVKQEEQPENPLEFLVDTVLSLKKELDSTKEQLSAYVQREVEQKKKVQASFIDSIREETAKLGLPIEQEKLDRIQSLFDAGLEEIAFKTGNDYLELYRLAAKDAEVQEKEEEKEDSSEVDQAIAQALSALGIESK